MFGKNQQVDIFLPHGGPVEETLQRTTSLCLAAHHDDIEMMAFPAVLASMEKKEDHFTGVVLTDGRGSPRQGPYAQVSDEEMMALRKKEQQKAAVVGEYNALILLNYKSSTVKSKEEEGPVDLIFHIIKETTPQIIYTHNLVDGHNTHVATALRVIEAVKRLPSHLHPRKVYGCEVWRDLDWLLPEERVVFDVSGRENLASALMGLFDSQIQGGKRYDLAVMGRRRAHATFSSSHQVDTATSLAYAMDLTPLIKREAPPVREFIQGSIQRFAQDVDRRISCLQRYLKREDRGGDQDKE